jgi:hypothetical protein
MAIRRVSEEPGNQRPFSERPLGTQNGRFAQPMDVEILPERMLKDDHPSG